MRQVLTMTAADLRQRVRDRSVLIFGLAVPLGLMVVFNLVFGATEELELQPVTVAVAAPAADPLAAVVPDVLGQVDAVDVTVERTGVAEVRERAEAGRADLGVIVPDGFGTAVSTGQDVTIDVIEGDGAGLETDILIAVVDATVDQLAAGTVAANAGLAAGLLPTELPALAERAATAGPVIALTAGEASTEQLSDAGALVAGQAGLFLLFTVGFGVLGLVAEREQGTLARLRSMPMRPGAIVAAKALTGFVLGALATTVLLTSGGLMFEVSFGSPLAVAVLIACVSAAATSLMFVVARLARTAEQAGVVQAILAISLGLAGGAFFPLAATGTLGRLLDLNPLAAFSRGLGITAGGGGLGDLGVPVATMLGFAVVAVALSRLLPDRGAAA